ncbi:MAG: methyltransferase domain-containing protein [Candidatus Parcubacteria bacterium]|nr:methyltransferase domain-containing protein [Burkholderiales bacterium]
MSKLTCRFCGGPLIETFADLGTTPLANSFVPPPHATEPDIYYPLHARVCGACLLVQLPLIESRETIFRDYSYFSSYSDSWLEHCRRYAGRAAQRFALGPDSLVVEVASNDGYLLQYFRDASIPVLGVEPAANVALAAEEKGVRTRVAFFGAATAQALVAEGFAADLAIANNVLAHVPDINDFVSGFKILLKPAGVLTVEFPSLGPMIAGGEFDTIYHEHFSYLCLRTAGRIFAAHGLDLFDVEHLPTHGGSLRLYLCHRGARTIKPAVEEVLREESAAGLDRIETYRAFAAVPARAKAQILEFLLQAKQHGKRVAGYGAPAKGNTLLNYCGIGPDLIPFTVDRSPHKQGRLLPGSRIPVRHPDAIAEARPDYLFILPWNLRDEIAAQMSHIRAWGGRFVVPVPGVKVF